jgi:hypothetical protein
MKKKEKKITIELTYFLPRYDPIELKITSNERGIKPGLFNGPIIVYVLPEPVIPYVNNTPKF